MWPWLATVLAFALLLAPGLMLQPGSRDFFMAGRRAGPVFVGASLVATSLGASATLGIVGTAYALGWPAFWWLGSGGLGLILLGAFWIPAMRARPATRTLPQWAGTAYGVPARVLAAILIDVMWTGVIAAQWVAAGAILEGLLGWPVQVGILVAGTGVATYTAWGGQRAVLRTDLVQVAAVLVALGLPLFFLNRLPATGAAGGWPGAAEFFTNAQFSLLDWFALVVVVGSMYVVGPDLCSRVLLARSNAAARRGAVAAGLLLLPCSVAVVAIGLALRRAGVALAAPREALPWLICESGVMPAWAGLLVSVGLLAAMLSSADTCLLTAASVFELDLVGRRHAPRTREWLGRVFVVGAAFLSMILAICRPRIIPNMLLAYAFYCGGLLLPLLMLGSPRLAEAVPRRAVWLAIGLGGTTPVVLLGAGRTASSAVAGLCGVGVGAITMAAGTAVAYITRRQAQD